MAKKKVTKKASPRKSVSRSSRSSGNSWDSFFKKHRNMRWLLPVLIIVFCVFLLIHHYTDGMLNPNDEPEKNSIRNYLQLPADNDTLKSGTPVTLTPTPTSALNNY